MAPAIVLWSFCGGECSQPTRNSDTLRASKPAARCILFSIVGYLVMTGRRRSAPRRRCRPRHHDHKDEDADRRPHLLGGDNLSMVAKQRRRCPTLRSSFALNACLKASVLSQNRAIVLLWHVMCWIVSLVPQIGIVTPLGVVEAFQLEKPAKLAQPHRRGGPPVSNDVWPQAPTFLFSQVNPNEAAAEAEALANLEQTRAALQKALSELDQIHQYQMAGKDTSDVGEDGRSGGNIPAGGSGSNMGDNTRESGSRQAANTRNQQEAEVERVRAQQVEQLERKAEAMQRKATAVREVQRQSEQSQNRQSQATQQNQQTSQRQIVVGQGVQGQQQQQQRAQSHHPNNMYPYGASGGADGRFQAPSPFQPQQRPPSQPQQFQQGQVVTGQAQYQGNMSPERRFQTINAATSIPSNYNLNEAAQPPPMKPPMNAGGGQFGGGGFGGQQQQYGQPPMGYGYGQQQQQYNGQPPMQNGPYGGGQQQQQQYPPWAQSTVAPWSPTSEQAQRTAAAASSNPNQGTQQGYNNPRPDGQALTDAQRAAQSIRDETSGRPSSAGTVEERRAQKVREAQSAFRNAASRERFEAGNVGQYRRYAAGYGIGGGGMAGGIGGSGMAGGMAGGMSGGMSGYNQQMPMQQQMGYGGGSPRYSVSGPFGDASYFGGGVGTSGQYNMGSPNMGSPYSGSAGPSFGGSQYNQGGFGGGFSSSGGFGSQSLGQQSMYGAGGGSQAAMGFGGGYGYGTGSPMGGQQQDEFVEHVRVAEQQREYEKELKRQYLDEARRNQQQRLQLPPSGAFAQEQPQEQPPPMQGQTPSQPLSSQPPPNQATQNQAPASKAGSNSYLDSISAPPNPSNVTPPPNPSPANAGTMPLPNNQDSYTGNAGPYPMPPPFQGGIQQW